METASVGGLINSISRLILLVSCLTRKLMPVEEDYRNMVAVIKLLKPLLDEVVGEKISSDGILYKECEELDASVNEAREFLENCCPKRSKICSVLQCESFLMKIKSYSLQICQTLHRLLQSSPSTSSMIDVEHCMQQIECLKQDRIAEDIKEVLRSQRDGVLPCTDFLINVVESLSLTSNQELLSESIAIEKERMDAQGRKAEGIREETDHIVDLISHMRDCMLKIECFEPTSGVLIPSYFRCPLSLELMSNPVILASGQTYDRASIQKWLDHGFSICPKTRQTLAHTNLVPNYTVKAMIASWCDENKIQLLNNMKHANAASQISFSNHLSFLDLVHTDSFRCSLRSNSLTSRSSFETGNVMEKEKADVFPRYSREYSRCKTGEIEKFDHSSPEQSYIHSRTGSASSAISSIDYMPPPFPDLSRSKKHENGNESSEEICSATSPSTKESGYSPWLTGKQIHVPRIKVETAEDGNCNYSRSQSFAFSDSGCDELTTTSHVNKLVEDLKSHSHEVQTEAAAELRFLAKNNPDNRAIIGQSGAIGPLLLLLNSKMKLTQEHAVTALLNLSINEENKAMIAKAGAVEPLVHALKSGTNGAKENAAVALFSLSVLEDYRAKIGRSGAIKALVDLLSTGTLRGKKDAATALFNLSIYHENKARIIQAGAMKYLVDLMDPDSGMVDKSVALLANLSTISEGRLAISREGGIPFLVEVVESGSQRGKENAASILLQLCLNSTKFCTLVLQEGAVPPLVCLSQSGTPRAKEKAQQLLSHFRNQREGSNGMGKS